MLSSTPICSWRNGIQSGVEHIGRSKRGKVWRRSSLALDRAKPGKYPNSRLINSN